jgi:pimeloyl-ACP methyl ester carboxylesterase
VTINFPEPTLVPVNQIRLAVHEAGDPEGAPIVLCHGFPELAFSWRHQIRPLADAGYHVMAPDQRGYGRSDIPEAVEDYDIHHLCGDMVGLLDAKDVEQAVFVGHDWGAIVVWNLATLHPDRVRAVINLSVPFMPRAPADPVSIWERRFGGDFYIVHFNRQPGVADTAFAKNTRQFLTNLYRTKTWEHPVERAPGMGMINMSLEETPRGEAFMSGEELDYFVDAFERTGFTGGINWYRNFTRNWETTEGAPQKVELPALMIYGEHDAVGRSENLQEHVPNVDVHVLGCGHWIQQERPEETNAIILDWLKKQGI